MTAPPIARSETIREIHDPLTAALRVVGCIAFTLLMAPAQALFLSVRAVGMARRYARWYWRGVALIVGLKVIVRGAHSPRQPVLYVSNHISYLDIIALGSVLQAAFVAKQEVRGWPGIGLIALLGRTVFVDRRARKSVAQRDEMLDRLARSGESLLLFPEGTSAEGNLARVFKSALFSAAEVSDPTGRPIAVQPLTIAYTRLDGLPLGQSWRPFYAWYGGMELGSHAWWMLGLGNATVEIELHPAVALDQFASRKELAEHCRKAVAKGLATANAGRLPVAEPAAPELS